MSFGKFIIIPILLGVQAAIMMLIAKFIPGSTPAVGGPGLLIFVAFQAWAVYFAAGCTPKNGVKVILAYAAGIAASMAIMLLGDALAGPLGSAGAPNYYISYPIAVFIIVIPAISLERIPIMDFIPGLFIGSGMFFAIMTLGGSVGLNEAGEAVKIGMGHDMPTFMSVAIPELIACAVGQVFGFITVTWRGAYEAKVGGGEAAPAAEAA
jgi:hypothetical protein